MSSVDLLEFDLVVSKQVTEPPNVYIYSFIALPCCYL